MRFACKLLFTSKSKGCRWIKVRFICLDIRVLIRRLCTRDLHKIYNGLKTRKIKIIIKINNKNKNNIRNIIKNKSLDHTALSRYSFKPIQVGSRFEPIQLWADLSRSRSEADLSRYSFNKFLSFFNNRSKWRFDTGILIYRSRRGDAAKNQLFTKQKHIRRGKTR